MSLNGESEKREGGRHRSRARVRWPRAFGRHVLAIVAAMMMALSAGFPPEAQSAGYASGTVIVICADGVAKTVVLDDEGNPMSPYGEEVCAGACLCGPSTGLALPPEAQRPDSPSGATAAVLRQAETTVLVFERGLCAAPRGPPSEDIA